MDLPSIRTRIDRLSEQIVGRLKDRSYFPHNSAIYRVGGVTIAGGDPTSFLEYSLAGLERYHASLGRYSYPEQSPLRSTPPAEIPVQRVVETIAIPQTELHVWEALLAYYEQLLPQLCSAGEDPQTYGETVYVDADLLVRLHERMIIGRYVAHTKAERYPDVLQLLHDPEALRAALVDPAREQLVLANAAMLAEKYRLPAPLVQEVFAWIMQQTLALEVRYLRQVHGA